VTGIAALILRFSRRYLDGERGQSRYVRWFLATIAAATLLVVTNHLLVLGLAWLASSLTLHQLLTFHDDRPQALVAAHKKFLLGRIADVAIFAAIALLWRATGTFEIDALLRYAEATTTFPLIVQVAGVLLATGVALRSAQLPFHGWLIQVMEAPTPVSALLHAGIVNIGGFVLIRLGGLLGKLDAGQLVLVVGGTMTAVLAALVMTTRVSIKVALAWSTCAQMGFMLLECGLGTYGLALLHLAAHSLYKAHAFLSSGRAVEQQVLRRMVQAPAITSRWPAVAGAAAALALVTAVGTALGVDIHGDPGLVALALVLALAVAPLLARPTLPRAGAAAGLVLLYAAWHVGVARLLPSVGSNDAWGLVRATVVAIAFVLLYATQATLAARPSGRLARAIYPACFAGFYLDEIMTRLTFRVWPPGPAPVPRLPRYTRAPIRLERAA
jgi:NAD(P)H-quinone oxidoreductase subunit 5